MPGLDGSLHSDVHIQEEKLKGGQTLARLSPLTYLSILYKSGVI